MQILMLGAGSFPSLSASGMCVRALVRFFHVGWYFAKPRHCFIMSSCIITQKTLCSLLLRAGVFPNLSVLSCRTLIFSLVVRASPSLSAASFLKIMIWIFSWCFSKLVSRHSLWVLVAGGCCFFVEFLRNAVRGWTGAFPSLPLLWIVCGLELFQALRLASLQAGAFPSHLKSGASLVVGFSSKPTRFPFPAGHRYRGRLCADCVLALLIPCWCVNHFGRGLNVRCCFCPGVCPHAFPTWARGPVTSNQ